MLVDLLAGQAQKAACFCSASFSVRVKRKTQPTDVLQYLDTPNSASHRYDTLSPARNQYLSKWKLQGRKPNHILVLFLSYYKKPKNGLIGTTKN